MIDNLRTQRKASVRVRSHTGQTALLGTGPTQRARMLLKIGACAKDLRVMGRQKAVQERGRPQLSGRARAFK